MPTYLHYSRSDLLVKAVKPTIGIGLSWPYENFYFSILVVYHPSKTGI